MLFHLYNPGPLVRNTSVTKVDWRISRRKSLHLCSLFSPRQHIKTFIFRPMRQLDTNREENKWHKGAFWQFSLHTGSAPWTATTAIQTNLHASTLWKFQLYGHPKLSMYTHIFLCNNWPFSLSGSDVTPNYSDSSPFNITISLWCTCRGTGGQEGECDAFHRDFTHNTCLSECSRPVLPNSSRKRQTE